MAITSPGLVAAIPALFGNVKPCLDALKKLGFTDFAASVPDVNVAPNSTVKVPISSVTAASAYNASSNNYLTGGNIALASLTATHYLKGFDVTGADIETGFDLNRMKQLFTVPAGLSISAAIQSNIKSAFNAATWSASSVVTLGTIGAQTGAPTLANYLNLAGGVDLVDKSLCTIAVNGTLLTDIKAKLAGANVVATSLTEIAQFMGFKDMVLIPGMTPRAVIVPMGSVGFLARVPKLIARYLESDTQTDDDTGLSIGIVIADNQADNKIVANADLWFGTAVQAATESGGSITAGGAIKIS